MNIYIETERLILRALTPADAHGMFALNSDPEVQRYLGNHLVKSLDESLGEIEFIRKQYVQNGIGRWAVLEKSSGDFIGWAGLKLILEPTNQHLNYYDIGYRFIKKYWGKGFATEAAKAILDYGFDVLQLNEIYGIADLQNAASLKVLEKVGLKRIEIFEYEGIPHQWMKIERVYPA